MSPRTSKQYQDIRESSKENILQSALTLFSSKGFFNSSIRQIAKQANISTGLLYNYFESKEDLLTEIVNNSFESINENEKTKLSNDVKENIEQTISHFFHLIRTKQELMRMMTQIGLQSKKFNFVNNLLIKKYKNESEKLTEQFNHLNLENSKIEATILMATLDGILFQTLVLGQTISLDEMEKSLIDKYTKL